MLWLLPGRKSSVKIFQNSDPLSRIRQSCYWFIIFTSFRALFIYGFGLRLSSENKISKTFLLELHFSLAVLNSTGRTWSVFCHKRVYYACSYSILKYSSLKLWVGVEHAGCISKFISKSKVSYKYFDISKLIFLGIYLKKYSITGMNQLKTPKVKNSNPIYDNSS